LIVWRGPAGYEEDGAGGHESGDAHAADGIGRVAEEAADASSDGDEEKTEDYDENSREEILVPVGFRARDGTESEKDPNHGDDGDGADDYSAHGDFEVDTRCHRCLTSAFGANVFEARAQSGNDGGHGAEKSDESGGGDGSSGHGANVAFPNVVRTHERNGNGGGIDGHVVRKLAVKLDGGHDDEPGDDASGKKNSGNARADDVADAEVFGGDGGAEGSAGKPRGAGLGLRDPSLDRVHEKGIDAAEAESPEDAAGERATAFSGDENVSTGSAFRKRKIAVLFDDELAAERNHEENAEPSAEKGERENAPESELLAEAEEN